MASCNECIHYDACMNIYRKFTHDTKSYTFTGGCELYKPTADVVEVVRCKDCEYYTENYEDRYGNKFGRCDHPQQGYDLECYDMWVETKPNDFCSYGERKEGDTQ